MQDRLSEPLTWILAITRAMIQPYDLTEGRSLTIIGFNRRLTSATGFPFAPAPHLGILNDINYQGLKMPIYFSHANI